MIMFSKIDDDDDDDGSGNDGNNNNNKYFKKIIITITFSTIIAEIINSITTCWCRILGKQKAQTMPIKFQSPNEIIF